MQNLLANYLFQNNYCSIPNIGTLQIKYLPASSIFGERKISAPIPVIELIESEKNAELVEAYIAVQKSITKSEASHKLNCIVNDIQNLSEGQNFDIPNAGKFYKDENGKIGFVANQVPFHFLPQVTAERVIHANLSHTMLVGETETNSTAMTEYFAEEAPALKSKWWIFALVSFAIVASTVGFYLSNKKVDSFFGAANKVVVNAADSSYKILP